jgi:hypothetical protein
MTDKFGDYELNEFKTICFVHKVGKNKRESPANEGENGLLVENEWL